MIVLLLVIETRRKKSRTIDHEHEHDGKNRVFYYSIFPNMLLSLASRLRHGASTSAAVTGADTDLL